MITMRRIITLILASLVCLSAMPKGEIDSISKLLPKSHDTVKIELYIKLSSIALEIDSQLSIHYINKALELAEKHDLLPQKARCLQTRGKFYNKHGDYIAAIENENEAIQIWDKLHDNRHLAGVFNDLGATYVDKGDYKNAIEYLVKSLKIYDKTNDSIQKSKVLLNIGLVFYHQQNYNKALEYYNQSLEIKKRLKDKRALSLVYNNLGIIYYFQHKHLESINAFKKSLSLCQTIGYKRGMSMPMFNIAEIYFNQDKYDSALIYYQKSYSIDTSLKDRSNIVKSLIKQAEIYRVFEKKKLAIIVANEALDLAKEIDSKEDIKDSYETLSNIYSDLKDYKKAFHYSESLNQIKDTLYSTQSSEAIAELQTKYETEKKDLQLLKQKETIKNQKLVFKILIVGILLSVFFITLILIEYFQKKRAYKEISIQKENITDSINYASRIQTALLPPEDLLNNLLPNHFILYMPRDIVSGDFYWITFSCDRTIIAVADCTGHGVPGAFMSMLSASFLNEIVLKDDIVTASQVLDELRSYIIHSLRQNGTSGEQSDGMDIAFIVINTIPLEKEKLNLNEEWQEEDIETFELQYAGAYNPIYIIKKLKSALVEEPSKPFKLFEFKGDKMPVSIHVKMTAFTNQTIHIQKGDIIYMMSDGFKDQFGGPKDSKYLGKNLKTLLLNNCTKTMAEQRDLLDLTIETWKNHDSKYSEQTDDITIMGIRI